MNGLVDDVTVTDSVVTGDFSVAVVDVGDIFKNGLLAFVSAVNAGESIDFDAFKLLAAARTLLSSFGDVISALKMLSVGTLIFSMAPRVSEKCVTVTFSLGPFEMEFG